MWNAQKSHPRSFESKYKSGWSWFYCIRTTPVQDLSKYKIMDPWRFHVFASWKCQETNVNTREAMQWAQYISGWVIWVHIPALGCNKKWQRTWWVEFFPPFTGQPPGSCIGSHLKLQMAKQSTMNPKFKEWIMGWWDELWHTLTYIDLV